MLRPVASAGVVRPTVAALFRRLGAAVSLVVACCLWASRAHAHEIGLSVVELQVQQAHLTAQLTFAQSEVEALVAVEKGKPGKGTAAMPESARPGLEALALTALELTLDERPLHASEVAVQPEPNNTIQFRLSFPISAGSRLGVQYNASGQANFRTSPVLGCSEQDRSDIGRTHFGWQEQHV